MKKLKTRIQNKIDTTSNWQNSKLILLKGKIAYEETPNGLLRKVGDGINLWKDLPYENSTSNSLPKLTNIQKT